MLAPAQDDQETRASQGDDIVHSMAGWPSVSARHFAPRKAP